MKKESGLKAQFKRDFGRQWKDALLSYAQAIALAGCGEGKCLVNRELCPRCANSVLLIVLAAR